MEVFGLPSFFSRNATQCFCFHCNPIRLEYAFSIAYSILVVAFCRYPVTMPPPQPAALLYDKFSGLAITALTESFAPTMSSSSHSTRA